jgi:hypothetical protein
MIRKHTSTMKAPGSTSISTRGSILESRSIGYSGAVDASVAAATMVRKEAIFMERDGDPGKTTGALRVSRAMDENG